LIALALIWQPSAHRSLNKVVDSKTWSNGQLILEKPFCDQGSFGLQTNARFSNAEVGR
jgi:hypothetical protein